MKRIVFTVLVLAITVQAWSADRITVAELKQRLQLLHDARKDDHDVTIKLAEVELTESLSAESVSSLESLLPGKESRDQLNFLAVQSAFLLPPNAEIPTTTTPDLATQKAILGKCIEYVTKVYMQNPHLIASKLTTYSGNHIKDFHPRDLGYMIGRKQPVTLGPYGTHTMEIESENGVEKALQPIHEDNRSIESQLSTGPVLSFILAQAAEGGHLAWLRWQLIHGRPAGVFSFAVDKTKSRYQVNYCCFAKLEAKNAPGTYYYDAESEPFKTTVPFRGALFIDPETGTIVRLIMQAEFLTTDPVHHEDTRIDYGSFEVAGKSVTVPVAAFKFVALVPRGNNDTLGYQEVLSFSEAEYSNYRLANQKLSPGSK